MNICENFWSKLPITTTVIKSFNRVPSNYPGIFAEKLRRKYINFISQIIEGKKDPILGLKSCFYNWILRNTEIASVNVIDIKMWRPQQQITFICTIQIEDKKEKKKNKYRKQNNRRFIIIYTSFELVCNSQSRKAFELAAAYLQVKKGTKKTNNN